jgi:hypothetical protein
VRSLGSEESLLRELHAGLVKAYAPLGLEVDTIDRFNADPDMEVHRCGTRGVLAFLGDYVLMVLPDPEDIRANREVYRLLAQRLSERGIIRHMVHPKNFASVKSTRRLGAVPVGYDADGYMHYTLTPERFKPYDRFKPR